MVHETIRRFETFVRLVPRGLGKVTCEWQAVNQRQTDARGLVWAS